MEWSDVGDWVKKNAGKGASLVGSLLTGNVPGAVAAGVSLISGATGSDDPDIALAELQGNPEAMVRLRELAYENEADIREHIRNMKQLELEDKQKEHLTTQETIRAADRADDRFVRWTRPGQSWVSLGGALFYVFYTESPEITILGALLTMPWAYAGLRQVGKGIDSFSGRLRAVKEGKR